LSRVSASDECSLALLLPRIADPPSRRRIRPSRSLSWSSCKQLSPMACRRCARSRSGLPSLGSDERVGPVFLNGSRTTGCSGARAHDVSRFIWWPSRAPAEPGVSRQRLRAIRKRKVTGGEVIEPRLLEGARSPRWVNGPSIRDHLTYYGDRRGPDATCAIVQQVEPVDDR
jgi:hypothetical protein